MTDVISIVKAMEANGEWIELREQGEALLARASVVDHARIHAALSTAFFFTANGPDDWRSALDHAHSANRLADRGSAFYVWTLQKLSSLYVAIGRTDRAAIYAREYLRLAPAFGDVLKPYTPYVVRDLSHVAYRNRQFGSSASLRRQSAQLFDALGNDDESCRTSLNLVWALVRKGDTVAARLALPEFVPTSQAHLFKGAVTAILFAEKRYDEAVAIGRQAIAEGVRLSCDFVDAAEVSLLVADALSRTGHRHESFAFQYAAAFFSACQDVNVLTLIVLHRLGENGGENLHARSSSRGSADPHDACALTSGIA